MEATLKYLYLSLSSTEQRLNKYSSQLKCSFFSFSEPLCSLCGAKQSHVFKFCEHLKASSSNTMTRIGSRSSNSCYFTPKRHQKRGLKSKIFLGGGGHAPRPPSGRALRALLRFAKCSDQVHTGKTLFKILDPPLLRYLLNRLPFILLLLCNTASVTFVIQTHATVL